MLSTIKSIFSFVIISALFFSSSVIASAPKGKILPLEPVWEKIDGQWKFNQSNITDRQILIHITSSNTNTGNKKLLIKELVKLPFVVFVEQGPTEISPN